jgi:hypothetical protein
MLARSLPANIDEVQQAEHMVPGRILDSKAAIQVVCSAFFKFLIGCRAHNLCDHDLNDVFRRGGLASVS